MSSALPFRPPMQVTLAADARLQSVPLTDDFAWTLHASFGLWEAMALVTSYGLRVESMALFPMLAMGGQTRWAAPAFAAAPQLQALHPAYARLTCRPFLGLALTCEYWVAHPQAVLGRLTVRNVSQIPQGGELGIAAVLRALDPGSTGMGPQQAHAVHVLQGEGGGLRPVVFLTGGAEGRVTPYPSLMVAFDLPPDGERRLTWVHTALADVEAGFELARQLAARPWPPFLARLDLLDAQTPRLSMGDEARQWVFLRARQTALRLLHSATLPRPFFLTARNGEHGGTADPLALNRAPSVTEAYHLATGYLLPTAADVVRGWVSNFLTQQAEDGFVPWRPTQPESRRLASPLLVELAYRAVQHDEAALGALYRPLRRFVEAWYVQGDANRDGLPEWSHPLQMGLADVPGFSPWRRESVGADFATVESPALYALLYRALDRLEAMARSAGETPPPDLAARRRRLRKRVDEMWDARRRAVLYRDYETHERPPHLTLGKHRGAGTLAVAETFAVPSRVVVQVYPQGGAVRPLKVLLQGSDARGKPVEEVLTGGRLRWHEGRAVATSQAVFRHLAAVTVEGLRSRGRFVVLTPDYFTPDISLLLPFWAGMLSPERAEVVRRALAAKRAYARPFGAPLSPRGGQRAAPWQRAVWMPWNTFAVEGLLEAGFREDAARLLQTLAAAAARAWSAEGVFRETYHADTGEGMGGVDALAGLPPLGLWLRVAGIQPVSPRRVRFLWPMPFDEALTVEVWGWRIQREPGRTLVAAPDGQIHTLTTPEPLEVAIQ